MTGSRCYFDTTFLFRLYWNDPGYITVRQAAATVDTLVCGLHGQAELIATAHRKLREGVATVEQVQEIVAQAQTDSAEGGIQWLPLTDTVLSIVEAAYLRAPSTLFLRSAVALHLACAQLYGLDEIYSNDRHLLAAAPLFKLRGINLIA